MACPVCYAPAADATLRESMNLGIFVLLGVTFAVLAGFAHFITSLNKRGRESFNEDSASACRHRAESVLIK